MGQQATVPDTGGRPEMARKTTAQIHDQVTGMMINALQEDTVPWHKPWTTRAGTTTRPTSLASRKFYRGTNVWTLGLTALERGYTSPWWGTYNQLAELSGMVRVQNPKTKRWYWASPDGTPRGVRRGEESTIVVFAKSIRVKDRDSDDPDATKRIYMLNYTQVFNACQADQLPEKYYGTLAVDSDEPAELPEPQAVIDAYLDNNGPTLVHAYQNRAFYTWGPDQITLPERKQFSSSEKYYSTAFHEVTHSTGNASRLDRKAIDHFGGEKYSREELVAEMGAAMLCAMTGVEGVFDNSASYIASWLKVLKGDSDMVIDAASAAQAAVDLILGEDDDNDDDSESEGG